MIGRKVFGVFAMLVFAGLMSAGSADARACRALCAKKIKACYKEKCTTKPKAACKRECRTHFITGCTDSSSTPKERVCPASPSGAFLE